MAAAPSEIQKPWLFGPIPDLLFGCGLAYAVVFAFQAAFGAGARGATPHVIGPLIVLLLGQPHYGGTLVRIYENRNERRKYAIFSIWATVALALAFVAGIRIPLVGTFLLTLYLTWSPWHYTGQNYGVAVMFLRRAGVPLDPLTKRFLYVSYLLSFVLIFGVMHQTLGTASYPGALHGDVQVAFRPLGISSTILAVTMPIVIGGYLATTIAWIVRLLPHTTLRSLTPALLLSVTQVLWLSLPTLVNFTGWKTGIDILQPEYRAYYFTFVAGAHSIQYLWVTAYFARGSAGWQGFPPYVAKVLVAGAAVWMIPMWIAFGLGAGPYAVDGGAVLVVAAIVNLHHFILDGAIWKLRGPIAERLVRNVPDTGPDIERPGSKVVRGMVWAVCGVAFVWATWALVEDERVMAAVGRGDAEAVITLQDRLAGWGRESAMGRASAGQLLLAKGELEAGRDQLEQSLALSGLAQTWVTLGKSHELAGEWVEAAEVYERAIDAGQRRPEFLILAARARLQAGDPRGARAHVKRGEELFPDDARFKRLRQAVRKQGW